MSAYPAKNANKFAKPVLIGVLMTDIKDKQIARLEKIVDFQLKDRTRGMTEILDLLRDLQEQNRAMKDTLCSIAAYHLPNATNPEFWDKSDLRDVAATIAEDTLKAREVLKNRRSEW